MPLVVKNLRHVYMPDSFFEHVAVDDVSFQINDGEFTAIIGHTGSGKSTLIQHLNGLLKPTSGELYLDGTPYGEAKGEELKAVRARIGMVFQYPEYQLFEETVKKDVAFGPKNMKLGQDEIDERVREAIELVGLDYDQVGEMSPFELSGGQKRRAAIAGVLAMRPEILILDEPTAGLDPAGREEILSLIASWHKNGKTIIMVSHNMDDVARFAEHVLVLNKGKLACEGTPREVFSQRELLEEAGVDLPQSAKIASELRRHGVDVPADCLSIDELEREIVRVLEGRSRRD